MYYLNLGFATWLNVFCCLTHVSFSFSVFPRIRGRFVMPLPHYHTGLESLNQDHVSITRWINSTAVVVVNKKLCGLVRYYGHNLNKEDTHVYIILEARFKNNVRKVWQIHKKNQSQKRISHFMELERAVAINVALHWGRTFFLNLAWSLKDLLNPYLYVGICPYSVKLIWALCI